MLGWPSPAATTHAHKHVMPLDLDTQTGKEVWYCYWSCGACPNIHRDICLICATTTHFSTEWVGLASNFFSAQSSVTYCLQLFLFVDPGIREAMQN